MDTLTFTSQLDYIFFSKYKSHIFIILIFFLFLILLEILNSFKNDLTITIKYITVLFLNSSFKNIFTIPFKHDLIFKLKIISSQNKETPLNLSYSKIHMDNQNKNHENEMDL